MANYQLFCTFAADMQRYFIFFGYDGTNYHGWQIQPHCVSVQEVLQRALSTLLRREMEVVGAGRTDAGVHARMMAAHFDFEEELDVVQLARKLNRLLPRDIAVDRVERVANDMHARVKRAAETTEALQSATGRGVLLQDCHRQSLMGEDGTGEEPTEATTDNHCGRMFIIAHG